MAVGPMLEEVKVVVIGETSSREPVPQCSSSEEEAVRMEFHTYQWNTKGMRMDKFNLPIIIIIIIIAVVVVIISDFPCLVK